MKLLKRTLRWLTQADLKEQERMRDNQLLGINETQKYIDENGRFSIAFYNGDVWGVNNFNGSLKDAKGLLSTAHWKDTRSFIYAFDLVSRTVHVPARHEIQWHSHEEHITRAINVNHGLEIKAVIFF